MEDEILKRIDALALKLGTTAERLWSLLIADTIRLGAVMSCVGAALIVSAWFVSAFARGKGAWDGGSEGRAMVSALGGFAVLVAGAIVFGIGVYCLVAPNREVFEMLVK